MRGIKSVDISITEEGRIYREDWYSWLEDCKCVLGVPSGSNVFDEDGEIAAYFEISKLTGQKVPKYIADRVARLDQKFNMEQISPRVFECAALGTPMALYEGSYSGVIVPNEHYFPIKTDKSNVDDFFSFLQDEQRLQEQAKRAYADLIQSEQYTYKKFIIDIRKIFDEVYEDKVVNYEALKVESDDLRPIGVNTGGSPETDRLLLSLPGPIEPAVMVSLRSSSLGEFLIQMISKSSQVTRKLNFLAKRTLQMVLPARIYVSLSQHIAGSRLYLKLAGLVNYFADVDKKAE